MVAETRKKRQQSPGRKSAAVIPPFKAKVAPSVPANHEVQGYMPGRLEFDYEPENEAEVMVKDMIFTEDDSPTDVDLKIAVLEIYNSKLDIRAERKDFIFDRNIIEFRKVKHLLIVFLILVVAKCGKETVKRRKRSHSTIQIFCAAYDCLGL